MGKGSGTGPVRIEGLSETLRALSKAGADAADMKELMSEIGNLVIQQAQPPEVSGNLASTQRASKTKNKAVVRAGGARARYAAPIHWGWPKRNIRPQPWLSEAADDNRDRIVEKVDDGIDKLLRKNNLK